MSEPDIGGRAPLTEQGKDLFGVLTVDGARAEHVAGSARELESRSFDQDGPQQRMHDPHVVAPVGELGIGQALRAVLHLVGRDAEVLQLVLQRRSLTGLGASRDDLVELVVALVTFAGGEQSEVGPIEPRCERPQRHHQ